MAALALDEGSNVSLILSRHGYSTNFKYPGQGATTEDVSTPRSHFSKDADAIIEAAAEMATSRGDPETSPQAIALAILRSRDRRVYAALTEQRIDVSSIIRALLFDDLYQLELWSEEGNRIIRGAHYERSIFRTDYIGTEHILLSLLRDSKNPASQFLERHYPIPMTIFGLAGAVKNVAGSGGCALIDLRFTPNANELLTASQSIAQTTERHFVGSEHILLAVLANRGSTAARALSKRISLDRLQKDLETAFQ